jgi:hypothetical protein
MPHYSVFKTTFRLTVNISFFKSVETAIREPNQPPISATNYETNTSTIL